MLLMLGILGMLLMISAFIIGVQFDITTLTMLYFSPTSLTLFLR